MPEYRSLPMKFLITLAILSIVRVTTAAGDDNVGYRSWLPVTSNFAVPASTPVDQYLASLNGAIRVTGSLYESNKLVSNHAFVDGRLTLGGGEFTAKTSIERRSDHLSITLAVKLVSGNVSSFGIAAIFDFNNWSSENYVLAPSQIYGGNRFRIFDSNYPPYIQDSRDRPLDMPITTTNILHLKQDGSRAKIEMNSGNLATPMLSFLNKSAGRGFILLTEQGTRFGNNGLFIEEDAGPTAINKRASFVVSAPGVREQRYSMVGRAETNENGADWKVGDEITINFNVYNFECLTLECFYEKVFNVRKALSGKSYYDNVTPFSVAANLIVDHHNNSKWFETNRGGLYNFLPGSSLPYHSQNGWGGVPIHSFPSLILETPERLRRVRMSMDYVLIGMQAKTGLYYAMSDGKGTVFGDTHATMAQRPAISMTRRTMDVLYFGIKTIDLMRQRGHAGQINPDWDRALRQAAEGLVKVWEDYGQFGQAIDVETGRMDTNGSTAGAAAGSALALASRHFNDPKLLEVAESAMKMYYERDFLRGYAGGGAADILQSPDSETPWDMLESCIVLYEITGKQEWVERAKFVTHMLATWVVSYDYKFPKGSMMERAGTRSTGSIFASSQNNHSAPGYFILSGDSILKLYRATGDQRYAELYKDQSHNVIQYMGAPYNPFRDQPGFVTERVQMSDWEGGDSIGNIDTTYSHISWEALVALTSLENPGIYLRLDGDGMIVLDHVDAEVIATDEPRGSKTLRLTNPTRYDASVSILAETAADAKAPLGWGSHDKWPRAVLKAGETKTFRVDRNGIADLAVTAPSRP